MSDSVQPHRWQPTRLLHPWDFPGNSTGVGCHCLLRNITYLTTNSLFVVQSLNHVQLFETLWTVAHQSSLSFTIFWTLLKFMSIELVMLSNHLFLCCPLLLLPSVFPSIRVFSNELALCSRWSKYWSFSFNISPSNEYSGLISFQIDWSDLLAVQGMLKSSPTPQFESISSLAPSLPYGPTLTSIQDYWENHSFDYIEQI